MKNMQSGSFKTNCGCKNESGKGNSGIVALFIELESNRYFNFGAKLGLDFKSTSSSYNIQDTVTFTTIDNRVEAGALTLTKRTDVSATYLFIAPYLSLTPFGPGFFVRIAPEFGSLMHSRLIDTRELPNTAVLKTITGDSVIDLRFQNGSNKETLEDGPIQEANKLRIAVFFSAGYDFRILDNLSLLPEASYNLPLTTISSSSQSSNWKISSIVLALGIKYRFD